MTTMEERFDEICDATECPLIGDRNSIEGCGRKCPTRLAVENIIRTECARAAKEAVVAEIQPIIEDIEAEIKRMGHHPSIVKRGCVKRLKQALSKYGITEK